MHGTHALAQTHAQMHIRASATDSRACVHTHQRLLTRTVSYACTHTHANALSQSQRIMPPNCAARQGDAEAEVEHESQPTADARTTAHTFGSGSLPERSQSQNRNENLSRGPWPYLPFFVRIPFDLVGPGKVDD